MNELNEYGVPLHACNAHRHDEHYWTWMKWVIENCIRLGSDGENVFYKKPVQ
jgi:hypothetical protein